MPSSKARQVRGLEVWLIGTNDELDLAIAALNVVGTPMQPVDDHGNPDREASQRHDLAGADSPRARQYLRLQMAVSPTAAEVEIAEVDMGLLAGAA